MSGRIFPTSKRSSWLTCLNEFAHKEQSLYRGNRSWVKYGPAEKHLEYLNHISCWTIPLGRLGPSLHCILRYNICSYIQCFDRCMSYFTFSGIIHATVTFLQPAASSEIVWNCVVILNYCQVLNRRRCCKFHAGTSSLCSQQLNFDTRSRNIEHRYCWPGSTRDCQAGLTTIWHCMKHVAPTVEDLYKDACMSTINMDVQY
jgi:hypothetical protein